MTFREFLKGVTSRPIDVYVQCFKGACTITAIIAYFYYHQGHDDKENK